MNEVGNSESKPRQTMRAQMPNCMRIIDTKRAELGAEYVNGLIKRGLAGEPGCFIAIEKGYVAGTPFPAGHAYEPWQTVALVWAVDGAVFLKPKE